MRCSQSRHGDAHKGILESTVVKNASEGFTYMKKENVIVFDNLRFNEQSLSQIMESIYVDKKLKVELQNMEVYNNIIKIE